jgi:steroid 5-alpha reductase family enzyme
MSRRVVKSTMDSRRRMRIIGDFILDHTLVSYVLWILLLFFWATPLVMTAPLSEPQRFGWLSWVTVVYLLDAPILAVLVDRQQKTSPQELVAIQWLTAQAPLLASVVVLYDRGPEWFGAIAYPEALVLMIWSVRRARLRLPQDGHIDMAT